MFRMFADVKMLENLPYLDIPELENNKFDIIESEPSDEVKKYVDSFVQRAEKIRNGTVVLLLTICLKFVMMQSLYLQMFVCLTHLLNLIEMGNYINAQKGV